MHLHHPSEILLLLEHQKVHHHRQERLWTATAIVITGKIDMHRKVYACTGKICTRRIWCVRSARLGEPRVEEGPENRSEVKRELRAHFRHVSHEQQAGERAGVFRAAEERRHKGVCGRVHHGREAAVPWRHAGAALHDVSLVVPEVEGISRCGCVPVRCVSEIEREGVLIDILLFQSLRGTGAEWPRKKKQGLSA